MKPIFLALGAIATGAANIPSSANAAVTVDIVQVGPNVVATATGTLNLAGLTAQGLFDATPASVWGASAFIGTGAPGGGTGYSGLTGPINFGAGPIVSASSSTGAVFAINGGAFSSPYVFVPVGYVSGSAISSNATFIGTTLASLGLTPGQYIFSSRVDSVTVNIGAGAVPEPATWAMMLLGFGGIGVALRRGRKTNPALA